MAKYPGRKFDVVNVEKIFRDLKKKGDFAIYFSENDYVSFSLKNYKNGFDRIQLCSGTWNSFLNNFLFESDGVGMFINPITNKRFKGSNRAVRDQLIEEIGFAPLAPIYSMFDDILDEVRDFYVSSEEANQWSNVATRWKNDCSKYGQQAAQSIVDGLNNLDNDTIKRRVIQMAGLTYEEEILLIGKGKYCCSKFNDKYAEILSRVNSDESVIEYKVSGKGVLFTITDGTEIVSIEGFRVDQRGYNVIATPGYPELMQNMINLNTDRNNTAFIVGDTPLRLEGTSTKIQNYANNTAAALDNGEDGLVSSSDYLGVFYPSGLTTDNTGKSIVVHHHT